MTRPDKSINKHDQPDRPESLRKHEWIEVSEVYPEKSQIYGVVDEINKLYFANYKKKRDYGNWINPYTGKKVKAWLSVPIYYYKKDRSQSKDE